MSIEVFVDEKRRYATVEKGGKLYKVLSLRAKLCSLTTDSWPCLFKTKGHKRRLKAIKKIDRWLAWFMPRKLNADMWLITSKDKNITGFPDWKYTIYYIVKDKNKT